MQPNREVYERKISQVYDMIDVGDYKKAFRQINSYLEKGGKKMHVVERLNYQLIKAYILEKTNRCKEAQAEAQGVLKEIGAQKLSDLQLIEQAELVTREMGVYKDLVGVLEGLYDHQPKDKDIALKLFNAYTQSNNFVKMGMMANKLEKILLLKDQAYGLFAQESNYLFWKRDPSAPPLLINLIGMKVEEDLKKLPEGNVPLYFASFYVKVLMAQKKWDETYSFLVEHKASFPIVWDWHRLLINLHFKRGDFVSCCNQLLTAIKENYQNIQSFQSIYNLHELLIVLLCERLLGKEAKVGELLGKASEVKVEMGQEFQLLPEKCEKMEDVVPTLLNLFGSFQLYESINLEDKTTNYHNCRKASILSQLLLYHKLLTRNFQETKGFLKAEGRVSQLFLEYMTRYIEVNSAQYDLLLFVPLLDQQSRMWVVEKLKEVVAAQKDDVRRTRASLNLFKLKKVFSLLDLAEVQNIYELYLDGLKLDGKPEKGDRKLVDDALLLINDMLQQEEWAKSFRVGLLEFGMEQSPYNFDIQLALNSIFDQTGCSYSFANGVQSLGLKGVQLESMGHFQMRHAFEWGDLQMMDTKFAPKYQKYQKLNSKDLKVVKSKALKENNFDQLENFIDYEVFIGDSYLSYLLKFQLYLADFLRSQGYSKEQSQEFFINMADTLCQEEAELQTPIRFKRRTQDLKVDYCRTEFVEEFEKFREPESSWEEWGGEEDEYLREVARGDKVMTYFKFPGTSNFKENLKNSLGVFEDVQLMVMMQKLLATIAKMKMSDQQVIPGLKSSYESYLKSCEERLSRAKLLKKNERLDDQGYTPSTKMVQGQIQLIIGVLELAERIASVKKVEGEPAADVAQRILQHGAAFTALTEEIKAALISSQKKAEQKDSIEIVKMIFIEQWIVGTLFTLAFELLGEKLKAQLPSKGKKKGQAQNESQEMLQNQLIAPLKNAVKDFVTHLQSDFTLEQDFEAKKGEKVASAVALAQERANSWQHGNLDIHQKIMAHVERKAKEMLKEEKITRERLRDMAANNGKKLKEIANTYLP